jgi:hypothetical protein
VVAVAEAMWWLELKQALGFSFGLGLCKIVSDYLHDCLICECWGESAQN